MGKVALTLPRNLQGFRQDLWLFGRKKGSGESIWDIKKQLGEAPREPTQLHRGPLVSRVLHTFSFARRPLHRVPHGLTSVDASPLQTRALQLPLATTHAPLYSAVLQPCPLHPQPLHSRGPEHNLPRTPPRHPGLH